MTDTTSGASRRTAATWSRCRRLSRTGASTRYHSSRAPTVAYSADQPIRLASGTKSGPTANWWLNASAMAR